MWSPMNAMSRDLTSINNLICQKSFLKSVFFFDQIPKILNYISDRSVFFCKIVYISLYIERLILLYLQAE